jgi:hypothetical protein
MRHAGDAALDRLEPLLARVRELGWLKETRRGVFYAKSRAVLHFHEDPAGLFADLRPPGAADFERIAVDGDAAQAALLDRLAGSQPAAASEAARLS